MIDLKANPFFLDDEGCEWVKNTLAGMSVEEKVGQVFYGDSHGETGEQLVERHKKIAIGGIMYRVTPAAEIKECNDYIQTHVKIPLLISANLESGGSGAIKEGTTLGSQIAVAATDDASFAYSLGDICGAEAGAVGFNYAFAPVVDVNCNWRNPIINTRTYGDDPERILKFAGEYMKGVMKHNFAVSLKHFPGDGVDERDHHLLISVNTLSCEEWDATTGRIYSELIKQGAQTVMVGHILLPEYSRKLCPGIKDADMLPASMAPELLNGLLREKLNFNGVIITDSATMTGMCCAMERRDLPTAAINAGCDMYLFGRNLFEDYENMLADAKSGKLSAKRLDEAVTRILALKASLGLHTAKTFTREDYREIIGCAQHVRRGAECADKSITLVKDTQRLLPISPKTHRRVWLNILGDGPVFCRGGRCCRDDVIKELERRGFEVTLFDKNDPKNSLYFGPVSELKKKYDLIMYVANVVSGSNNTVNRINWASFACGEAPQYVKDIPTLFVSLGDPYHYVDVPMIRTIVNCYDNTPVTIAAALDKLMGESEFKGVSPVDPFCGMWGAEL